MDVFDYCLFGMEESQWVLLLFQLKTIIPDLDWGRKINFWSFSSVNLNVEPVTLPSTCHLPDNPPPLLYRHLIPQPKMKGRAQKESGREGEKKGRKSRRKHSLSIKIQNPFCTFQLGYMVVASVYQNTVTTLRGKY